MEKLQVLLIKDDCDAIWKNALSENRLKGSMEIGQPYFKLLEATLNQVVVYKNGKSNLRFDAYPISKVDLREKTELKIESDGVEYSI